MSVKIQIIYRGRTKQYERFISKLNCPVLDALVDPDLSDCDPPAFFDFFISIIRFSYLYLFPLSRNVTLESETVQINIEPVYLQVLSIAKFRGSTAITSFATYSDISERPFR